MDRDIKLQDLHLHCRACLAELTENKHDVKGMARPLLKLFKKCANLKKTQSEFYPKSICGQCFGQLKSFDDFQEKTKESTDFLKQLLESYKPIAEEFLGEGPHESSAESEASLSKSEGIQDSINDSEKADDDPLQWVGFQAESSNQKELRTIALQQKEENDFESVLVKMEIKDKDDTYSLEKQATNESENTQVFKVENEKPTLVSKKLKNHLKCRICFEAFKSTKALKTHMEVKHDDEEAIFPCDQCDRSFNRRSRLKLHKNEAHAENPEKIACKFGCGKEFQRIQTAANHYRRKHAPPNADATNETEKITSKSKQLDNLPKSEFPNENKSEDETDNRLENEMEKLSKIKKKFCTICFGLFSNNTALRKHMNTHKDVRPYQCDKCERGFNCKSRFQKHMRELHSENPVEFVCKFGCGKVFKTSDSAGNHYRRQHSGKAVKTEEIACICEDCGRVFKCMTRLRQHSYQHRPIEERPFHCEVCNKRFVFKKTYKEHLLRHKGIKEFECSQCGLKKTTKQELRNHMKYHTDELKTPCPLCKKIFGNPPNLRRHIQLVHEGVKNFKCRFCDEAFGKAETLKHHEMRHTGEKPHKCEICEKSFIQLVALRTHMKTHNKLPRLPKVNRSTEAAMYEPTALMDISENTL